MCTLLSELPGLHIFFFFFGLSTLPPPAAPLSPAKRIKKKKREKEEEVTIAPLRRNLLQGEMNHPWCSHRTWAELTALVRNFPIQVRIHWDF